LLRPPRHPALLVAGPPGFYPPSKLRRGERLHTLASPAAVAAVRRRPSPTGVYNLEVYAEYVYHVSRAGLLVHNNGCGRTVPNPFGRPAGPAHRARILQVENLLLKRGWVSHAGGSLRFEKGYYMIGGNLRHPDLVMKKGRDFLAVQVGKRTVLRKLPVWRERGALKELRQSGLFKHVFYVGYP